jgi:hypothetical protein
MKFIYFFILSVLLFISCNKNKNGSRTLPLDTQTKKILKDSVANNNNTTLQDSSVEQKTSNNKDTLKKTKPIENILSKENNKTSNKIKSISELWQEYKNAKKMAAKFIEKNNLDSIIHYFNIAADASYELNRNDIATWQLNNIGYYSINKFKDITDYDTRMQKLSTMKNLRKKALYLKETKQVFRDNFNILATAQIYLYKAQLLDNELDPSDRTEKIERNLKFITWIENFIFNGKVKTRGSK